MGSKPKSLVMTRSGKLYGGRGLGGEVDSYLVAVLEQVMMVA